jgi:hypothetical protein
MFRCSHGYIAFAVEPSLVSEVSFTAYVYFMFDVRCSMFGFVHIIHHRDYNAIQEHHADIESMADMSKNQNNPR